MPFVGDVFGLSSVYEKQVTNVENNNFTSWPESTTYGYFGGGQTGSASYTNFIQRLELPTETTSNPITGLLSNVGRGWMSGTQTDLNTSYGYFTGGMSAPPFSVGSQVQRFDFSNETVSNPGNLLPIPLHKSAMVRNNNYGYFAGGLNDALSYASVSTIIRFQYTTETSSLPGNNLPFSRECAGGVSSDLYGYFGGGMFVSNTPPFPASLYSTINRLDFSNEIISSPGKNLPSALIKTATTSSNLYGSYGYFVGGDDNVNYINTISRLDFSTENISNPGVNLPPSGGLGGRSGSASVNSQSFGYFAGGNYPPASAYMTIATRLDFSNEVLSDPGKNLPSAGSGMACIQGGSSIFRPLGGGSKTYGYLFGGDRFLVSPPPQRVSTILRMDFSTEGYSDPGKNMPTIADSIKLVGSKEKVYGKWNDTQIIRFDYTNETNSLFTTPSTPTSSGSEGTASNSNYGYWLNLTRIDFSSETLSSPIAQSDTFTSGRSALITASASNLKYAYFAGGGNSTPNIHSTIHKLDFSNEVITQISSNISPHRYSHTGISGPLYGYFGAGINNSTVVNTLQKMDFSTELVTPMSSLSVSTTDRGGVSSGTRGYFSGGWSNATVPATVFSNVDRIEFSNDTRTTSTNLPIARDSHTGVSNSIS